MLREKEKRVSAECASAPDLKLCITAHSYNPTFRWVYVRLGQKY